MAAGYNPKLLSALAEATSIADSDLFAVYQNGVMKKVTADKLPGKGGASGVDVQQISGGASVTVTYADGTTKTVIIKDGATGATPQLQAGTVETVEPGATAEVNISGDAETPVLNFKIPRGQDGTVTFDFLTDEQKAELKGNKGDKGEKGDPFTYADFTVEQLERLVGPAGTTPNVQIGTVTTLPAGSDATASMTGTPANPLLNLGIPRGNPGSGGAGGGSDAYVLDLDALGVTWAAAESSNATYRVMTASYTGAEAAALFAAARDGRDVYITATDDGFTSRWRMARRDELAQTDHEMLISDALTGNGRWTGMTCEIDSALNKLDLTITGINTLAGYAMLPDPKAAAAGQVIAKVGNAWAAKTVTVTMTESEYAAFVGPPEEGVVYNIIED